MNYFLRKSNNKPCKTTLFFTKTFVISSKLKSEGTQTFKFICFSYVEFTIQIVIIQAIAFFIFLK